ncbi:MAG: hypothetical protein ABR500_10030 [Dermatophilaceae bacterium]|nr:hypothetical protein [Intrasporangiaceae bacterium]
MGVPTPGYFAWQADRLSTVFADLTVEVFDERHHFDPPHQVEPGGLAAALTRMWARPCSIRHRLIRGVS